MYDNVVWTSLIALIIVTCYQSDDFWDLVEQHSHGYHHYQGIGKSFGTKHLWKHVHVNAIDEFKAEKRFRRIDIPLSPRTKHSFIVAPNEFDMHGIVNTLMGKLNVHEKMSDYVKTDISASKDFAPGTFTIVTLNLRNNKGDYEITKCVFGSDAQLTVGAKISRIGRNAEYTINHLENVKIYNPQPCIKEKNDRSMNENGRWLLILTFILLLVLLLIRRV